MKTIGLIVLGLMCFYKSRQPGDDVMDLNPIVDDVLLLVRNDPFLRANYNTIAYPDSIVQSGVTISNIVMSNILNVYRWGNCSADTDIVNTTLTCGASIEKFSMTSRWAYKVLFVSMSGEVDFSFSQLSIQAVLKDTDFKNITMPTFKVTDISDVTCTKFTGASVVFNAMVKALITSIMNGAGKSMISKQIEDTARKIFNEIFGSTFLPAPMWSE